MKTLIFILCALVTLQQFKFRSCFLTYPISGLILDQLLVSLNVADPSAETDLMRYAIPGHDCVRECIENDRKVCHFNFTMKHYQILGGSCDECLLGKVDKCLSQRCVFADGVARGYLSLNFQLPGPKIQVCKDDIIVVDLHNDAEGTSTSLHWHGMRQFGTPFMDGVPYLTQCPIPYGESFRYSFYAADEGTHFYHSHSGSQKADGVYGPLIVRGIRKNNPNTKTYNHDLTEHTILMADWMHQNAEGSMPGLVRRSILSQSILVNGHGRFFNHTTNSSTYAPLTVFHVVAGLKYRFRLINSGLNVCPFMMQIEDHNFTIIATEVSYVKPMTIDSLYFLSGERYDFVIDTKSHELKDYWIRFRQLSPCIQQLEGFAILRYHKERKHEMFETVEFNARLPPKYQDEYPNGTMLNSGTPDGKKDLPITKLEDFRRDNELVEKKPDKTDFIFFDTPTVDNREVYNDEMLRRYMFTTNSIGQSFVGSANNISFRFPTFPLLVEPDRIREDMFCDGDSVAEKSCPTLGTSNNICRCIHRIKFKLGSIAELIIVNVVDKIGHPMHLHGHKFHVMDTGILRVNMTVEEVKRAIPKTNAKRPPYKDTVLMPFPGYTRIRFRANNPGFWLFHCHFDWHLPIGMAVMIQVGEIEQMRKPPSDFPKCSNYMPGSIV